MDESKETLRKILELTRENSEMLHKMQRSMFWGKIFRTVYWIFIIGAAIGAYYYIEPYINGIVDTYSGFKSDISNIFQ